MDTGCNNTVYCLSVESRKVLRDTQMEYWECMLEPYFLSDSLNIQDFKLPHGPFTQSLHQMSSPELHKCICRYELKVWHADVTILSSVVKHL
jgi:hypothetical protein